MYFIFNVDIYLDVSYVIFNIFFILQEQNSMLFLLNSMLLLKDDEIYLTIKLI